MAAAFIQTKKRQQKEFKQTIAAAEEGMDSLRRDRFNVIAHPNQIRRSFCSNFSDSYLGVAEARACIYLSVLTHSPLPNHAHSVRVKKKDGSSPRARPGLSEQTALQELSNSSGPAKLWVIATVSVIFNTACQKPAESG